MERGGLAGKSLRDVELEPDEECSECSSDSEANESEHAVMREEEDVPMKKGSSTCQTKKMWSVAEKVAVNNHLGMFLRTRQVPGKGPITNAMRAAPHVFKDRTWRNIKDFVRNQIKKKDPLGFLQKL